MTIDLQDRVLQQCWLGNLEELKEQSIAIMFLHNAKTISSELAFILVING